MSNEACHTMASNEILNGEYQEYPLFHAVLYGDKISTAKFSKRLSCAIKHLPLQVKFSYEHDTLKAIEKGVRTDPTLILDGNIFLEGLVQAESITTAFQELLKERS